MSQQFVSIFLLACSSCFMVVAWYTHLKFKDLSLHMAILMSWAIALCEYSLMVPANRIGHEVFSAAQLRILAEMFTLVAFSIFSVMVLEEAFTWNQLLSFALIFLAVYVAFFGPFPQAIKL